MGRYYNGRTLVCPTCNCEFYRPEAVFKNGANVRFCSWDCYKKNGLSGEKNGNWRGGLVDCTCLTCGKGFSVKQKVIRKGTGKFCSTGCSNKAQKRPSRLLKINCKFCEKEFLIKPSQIITTGNCCSKKCYWLELKRRIIGEGNPNYKNAGYENNSKTSIKRREMVRAARLISNHNKAQWDNLKRMYGNACASCKSQSKKLTKDHIVPITKGGHNGIDNIQPLCQRCNVKKFNREIKYSHQLCFVFD